jgi:multiple sugar transport system substrate-binding protein
MRSSFRRAWRGAALAATVGLLAACAGGGGQADETGPVTITIQEWNQIPGTPMEEVINTFQQQNPDIKIELAPRIPFGPEYDTRMQTQLGAGSAPTIFRMNDDFLTSFSRQGVLMDLSPYLEGADTSQYLKPLFDFGRQEDGTYTGFAVGTGPRVIFYNKTMFEQAGVPLPPTTYTDEGWKWSDFLAAAKALTIPGERWGAIVYTDEGFENTWAMNNGSPDGVFSKDGRSFTLADPVAAQGLQYVVDLTCKEHVQPPWAELTQDNASEALFGQGKVGMLHGAYATNTAIQEFVNGAFEYDIAPVPGNEQQVNENSLYVYVIPASTPQREADAAWKFLQYLGSEEAGAVLGQGGYYVPINAKGADAIAPVPGKDPQSMDVLVGSAAHGVVPNFPLDNASLAKQLYRPQLETAYNCDAPVQQVVDEVKDQVNQALQGG